MTKKMTKEEYLKDCMAYFSDGDTLTYCDGIITFCDAGGRLSEFNDETNEVTYF